MSEHCDVFTAMRRQKVRCGAQARSSINDEGWGRLQLKASVWLPRSRALSLLEEEVISVWCRRAAWGVVGSPRESW